jgi:SAM-dependent methyltransferase
MTLSDETVPAGGTGVHLETGSPLSAVTVARLATAATAHRPRTITEYGCGWGRFLLDCLAAAPGATGLGLDIHAPDIDRARRDADARGLSDRAEFRVAEATGHAERSDLLISVGAQHAFGTTPEALAALRDRLAPGGRALFGLDFWARLPTEDELAHMWPDASADDSTGLPEIVDRIIDAGWHVLDIHESTRAEFDAFDIGFLRERQEWIAARPDHPERAAVAREVASWIRGHRGPMGFVTFLLA